jgi:hypothetical protein
MGYGFTILETSPLVVSAFLFFFIAISMVFERGLHAARSRCEASGPQAPRRRQVAAAACPPAKTGAHNCAAGPAGCSRRDGTACCPRWTL